MILAIFTQISQAILNNYRMTQKNTNKRRTMTTTGRSPEHDLKAMNDGDISNPPAHDPDSTGGIKTPRSSHKTASRPSCPATDEHIVLHGARIMTLPAIRSNPLIPSTSVTSRHVTQTHTVQTSQFHDSDDLDLSSTDSDHDDDDQLKNKGRVFSTDSNDGNSDDDHHPALLGYQLKGTRLFSPKKESALGECEFLTID